MRTETVYRSVVTPTAHDVAVMDRQTKADIAAHNKAWQDNCHAKEN